MGLFSHIFCFCVSDDSGGVAQHVLNSLRTSKMVSYHAEHTHMMTRNIVNILPLSLRSSHLTQDVEAFSKTM